MQRVSDGGSPFDTTVASSGTGEQTPPKKPSKLGSFINFFKKGEPQPSDTSRRLAAAPVPLPPKTQDDSQLPASADKKTTTIRQRHLSMSLGRNPPQLDHSNKKIPRRSIQSVLEEPPASSVPPKSDSINIPPLRRRESRESSNPSSPINSPLSSSPSSSISTLSTFSSPVSSPVTPNVFPSPAVPRLQQRPSPRDGLVNEQAQTVESLRSIYARILDPKNETRKDSSYAFILDSKGLPLLSVILSYKTADHIKAIDYILKKINQALILNCFEFHLSDSAKPDPNVRPVKVMEILELLRENPCAEKAIQEYKALFNLIISIRIKDHYRQILSQYDRNRIFLKQTLEARTKIVHALSKFLRGEIANIRKELLQDKTSLEHVDPYVIHEIIKRLELKLICDQAKYI